MKQTEKIAYFFCNTTIILLGVLLIIFDTESVGGSLVAGGLSGMILYWAIYIGNKRKADEEVLLTNIEKLGIKNVLSRRLVKEEGDKLGNNAKHSMDVLGFGLSSFYEDVKDGQLLKVAEKAKIRILVVHPKAFYCKQLDYEEGKIEGTTQFEVALISDFVDKLNNPNIKLKWYKALPSFHMLRVDHEALVGPYLVGLVHRNTYTIFLQNGVLLNYYKQHFNKIWNDPNLSYEPKTKDIVKDMSSRGDQ